MKRTVFYGLLIACIIPGCGEQTWNNPYPESDSELNIYYDSFSERPKHLDPAVSYSANEYVFLGQIYEPPLQYHFLKRPYELIPLTATGLPRVEYLDSDGNLLGEDAPVDQVYRAIYTIKIQPGILYQPHPAFAMDTNRNYIYHNLTTQDLHDIYTLSDFTDTGTRELTAEDYIYQIKRMAHPNVHSPIAGLMMEYILGLDELSEVLKSKYPDASTTKKYIDLRDFDMKGIQVVDRYTFKIILKEKYPQFLYWLSMSFFAPLPWEVDYFYSQPGMNEKNITLDWFPVGTGPFMLTENNPNLRMVLQKNSNFRGELYPFTGEEHDRDTEILDDAGKAMPFIEKAIFSLEKESIPSWNKFLQGYYDTSGIVSDSFDQAVKFNVQGDAELTDEMRDKNIQLNTAITTSIYYMGFNMLDDVVGGDSERARLLRRAISIAVDYEEFISIFANGRGVPAQGPLPPGIFGYTEGQSGINPYVYEWQDGRKKRRSIEQAKKLMNTAGYPAGRDTRTGQPLLLYLDTPTAGPGAKSVFDWYRKQFNKLGINLVIRATDYNRFQDKMRKGTAQIYTWGWNADYPDPENFLFLLYGPNAKVEKNGENASNYKNKEFDRLFNQMKNMPNGPERQLVLDNMVKLLRADAPWLWGYHPVAFSLYHDWYHNTKPNLMANNTLKYKRIDPEKRLKSRIEWNRPIILPVIMIFIIVVISAIPAWFIYKRREHSAAL